MFLRVILFICYVGEREIIGKFLNYDRFIDKEIEDFINLIICFGLYNLVRSGIRI